MAKRLALVTGGMGGLGATITSKMLEAGYEVTVTSSPQNTQADAWVADMRGRGYSVRSVSVDVSDYDSCARCVAQVREEAGPIDILVNNAGITRDQLLIRMKDEDWDQVLDTNLRGIFLTTRAIGKVMMRQKAGRIINIGSAAGSMGNPGQVNYSAAKAGVIGLTKAAARELAHWNILVNAVAPGLIETDMTADIPPAAREALMVQVPLKRMGTGREVAETVRFLAGDGAGYITGQVIHVNGGLYM